MSWDIFVQDIPGTARSVADIPDDFSPRPISSPSRVLDAIRAAAPFADVSDPTWVRLDAPGVSIEVSLGTDDPLDSFAFHVHGGDCSAGVVADILDRLQLRAFDPASDSGIFDPSRAAESFHRWQEYRNHVLES
jgi:hypothetical protein